MTSLGKIGQLQIRRRRGKTFVEWTIPNFPSVSQVAVGGYYDSDPFDYAGVSWYLRVFPKGQSDSLSGCLYVYLRKEASSAERSVKWKLCLKKADGGTEGPLEESNDTFGPGEDERCRHFPIWLLNSLFDYVLSPNGAFTIMCSLKKGEPQSVVPAAQTMAMTAKPIAVKESAELVEASTQTQSEYSEPRTVKEPSESVEASTQTQSECYANKLSRDLSVLLLSGEDTDLTVKVKGVQFRLHRLIMGARTPVFSAMLRHDMAEKATGLVSVDDCEPDVFRAFVRYVYSGKVDELSTATAFGLFALADKYQVEELKSACFGFVQRTLSADTFCDAVKLALTYDKRGLLEQATDFLAERMEDILQTVKWMNFMRDHYIQANELMLKAVKRKTPK